jgi:hypothetical protein
VTLPLVAVLVLNSGADQLGTLRAVQQAPVLLISLFVGAWVDRWRSRNVMVLADFGRAVALAAIPIAYFLGVLGIPVLYAVGLVVGILTVFFDVAYQACLVRLIRRDQLAQGNSVLEGSRSAAQIGGPALGGALISLLSAPIAVVAGSFFFLLSFVSIQTMRRRERPAEYGEGLWRQIHEGLQLVVRDSFLRTACLASGIFQFFLAALMTVYLLFLPRTLHLPSSVVTISTLVPINFLFGTFGQLVDVSVTAIRQAVTPIQLQDRVVATMNFAGMGLTPLGSLLGGYLAEQRGLRLRPGRPGCGTAWVAGLSRG